MFSIRFYCLKKDTSNAIEQLRKLSQRKDIFGNHIRYLRDDPIFQELRQHPDFSNFISELENKFNQDHERIKSNLHKKGLL